MNRQQARRLAENEEIVLICAIKKPDKMYSLPDSSTYQFSSASTFLSASVTAPLLLWLVSLFLSEPPLKDNCSHSI